MEQCEPPEASALAEVEALVESAARGDTSGCLESLSRGADINAANKSKNVALIIAASKLKIETAMVLLARGANIRIGAENGEKILHHACDWPVDDYSKLIAMGAEVNALSNNGTSALHWASYWASNAQHVQALLFAGADPNIRNDSGQTPLFNALFGRNWEVVQLLVNAGADPNGKSARRSSHLIEAQSKEDWKSGCFLIALGAFEKSYAGKNRRWRRLFSLPRLHAAASGGYTALALKLIENGDDPTKVFLRKTPAQFAIETNELGTAAVLQACEARFAMDSAMMVSLKSKRPACRSIT